MKKVFSDTEKSFIYGKKWTHVQILSIINQAYDWKSCFLLYLGSSTKQTENKKMHLDAENHP